MGRDAMIFVFWLLSFKPAFSLSSFTLINSLFSSSLLSAIWVVSSAYLRLLIFLPAILIPACVSSSLAFHMMYSAYKFNKQGDNIQPWCTPLPIWNQSIVPSSYIRISNMFCVEGPVPMISTWPPPAPVTRETRVPLEVKTGSANSSHTWKCFPSHWTWESGTNESLTRLESGTTVIPAPSYLKMWFPRQSKRVLGNRKTNSYACHVITGLR